jgi:ABC-2 type transport system permease protein
MALQNLDKGATKLGIVKGHKERNIHEIAEYGLSRLIAEKPYRYSFINNGMDIFEIDLNKEISYKIDILLISDAKTKFSENELNNLQKFINKGGNLVITGDRKTQAIMNPILDIFGAKFIEGQTVQYNEKYNQDLVNAYVSKEVASYNYPFKALSNSKLGVAMQGAIGIDYSNIKKEYNITPLLQTVNIPVESICDTLGSWIEKTPTNFSDYRAKFDKDTDIPGPITQAISLTRQVNGKEQRIAIFGDSDFMSNAEAFGKKRINFRAANGYFINGLFQYLSYNKYPLNLTRDAATDNKLKHINSDNIKIWNILLKIIFPILLIISGFFIWFRRKNR